MQENDSQQSQAAGTSRSRRVPWLFCCFLAALALVAYFKTLHNAALLHHVPNAYSDPLLDNTLLASQSLWPRIFTGDLLLATGGDYRPVGYALFAAIHLAFPDAGPVFWHVVLLLIHLAAGLVVFATMRRLVSALAAAGWAAVYLVHPGFLFLLNDVNSIYILWGLLFGALTLWLYTLSLARSTVVYRTLSVVLFLVAVFTFPPALIAPAFVCIIGLFHERHPVGTSVGLVYAFLIASVASIWAVPASLTLVGLLLLAAIFGAASGSRRSKFLGVGGALIPYLLVAVLRLAVSASVEVRPVFRVALTELQESGLLRVLQPAFAVRTMVFGSPLYLVALAGVSLAPLLLLIRARHRKVMVAGGLAALVCITVAGGVTYRNNVTYWSAMLRHRPRSVPVEVNMAEALIEAGQYGEARELLMHLRYEEKVGGLARDTVNVGLGRAYEGLGNDKVAGYYIFPRGSWWRAKIMKNLICHTADFAFRLGYISVAEHFWACSLVIDPYDVRLYNNLGRALIYKNFFRAARKHFEHTLSMQPENATALYYLSFLADVAKDKPARGHYASRWREVTGAAGEPDFSPIFDGFSFDKEKVQQWFSGRPLSLLQQEDAVRIILHDEEYVFWEVPLEVGRYFLRRGDYAAAEENLQVAYELSSQSPTVARALEDLHAARDRQGRLPAQENTWKDPPDAVYPQ